jgi:hypothetical protein
MYDGVKFLYILPFLLREKGYTFILLCNSNMLGKIVMYDGVKFQ